MRYPIAIEQTDRSTFGVVVPDLPGCFSAGDSIDEAMVKAKEAIELWLKTVIEDGGVVPKPSSIDSYRNKYKFKAWIWAIVEIDAITRHQ
jgi:predicted RNase H-like HicB family nuclease